MTEREVDGLGRPTFNKRESQVLAFIRLYMAAKKPDDWDGPLGDAGKIALALNDTFLMMLFLYREEILIHRDLVARGINPQETEEDIRREFFGGIIKPAV